MSHGLGGHLAARGGHGHHCSYGGREATTLMLETLFDIKVAVLEIHAVLFGEDDEEEEEEDDT